MRLAVTSLLLGAAAAVAACGSRTSALTAVLVDSGSPDVATSSSSSGSSSGAGLDATIDVGATFDSSSSSSSGGASDASMIIDSGTSVDSSMSLDSSAPVDATGGIDASDAPSCPTGESFCDGACVDEQNDPADCGGCGVTCGGTCTQGRCLVALATTGAAEPWALAVDAANVYWTTTGTTAGTVMSVPIDGGAAVTLASGSIFPIAVAPDPSGVYWVNNASPYGVLLVPPGGPSVTFSSTQSGGVAVHDGIVYFTQQGTPSNGTDVGGAVLAEPVGGGATTTLATSSDPYSLVVANGRVFWDDLNSLQLLGVPLDGGAPVTLATDQSFFFFGPAADAVNLYWGFPYFSEGSVVSVAQAGGAPVTLTSTQARTFAVASDGTTVYWSNDGESNDGSIVQMPVGGGTPVTLASALNSPAGMAIDATSVYWVDQTAVWKMTPR